MTQLELLRYVVETLEKLGLPYMLVGSFASTAYGEPRFTQDIDIVCDLPLSKVDEFQRAFPDDSFYLNHQSVIEAIRTRFQFNVLHPESGNKIDLILPRDDEWGREQFRRRQRIKLFPDRQAYVAMPEDVILGKLWYHADGGSEKHLRDIAGILKVSGDIVDRNYVTRWADKLGWGETWRLVLDRTGSA